MAVSRINEGGLDISQYGNRNMLINGSMLVWQRGATTDATGVGASSAYYRADRWKTFVGGTATAGRLTMSHETSDLPDGFTDAMKLACTTADTSIAAGEGFGIVQHIESYLCAKTHTGTSSAKQITVSFYAKADSDATYVVQLLNNKHSGYIHNNRTFSVTSSWQRFELTFQADTTADSKFDGTQKDAGFSLTFWLHAGSDYTSATLASDWATGTTNRAAGTNSIFAATSKTFYVTGVQLEVGDAATGFEHLSFKDELANCKRYYNASYAYGTPYGSVDLTSPIGHMSVGGSYNILGQFFHTTPMRSAPSVSIYNPLNGTAGQFRGDGNSFANAGLLFNGDKGAVFYVNGTAVTQTVFLQVHAIFDAEL